MALRVPRLVDLGHWEAMSAVPLFLALPLLALSSCLTTTHSPSTPIAIHSTRLHFGEPPTS